MYHKNMGSYDEIPEGMAYYINNYGCHFNKKLCDWAVSQMYKGIDANGRKVFLDKPYTKEQVNAMMTSYGIRIERNKMYDAVYVANMCAADFLGKSIPDERHLIMYVKDLLDDPDAEDGFVFNRFYADTMFMNNPVEWEDMV